MFAMLMIVYMWVMVVVDLAHLCFKLTLISFQEIMKLFRPTPLKSIMGDVAMITGSGHGIGKELSLQMARLGAKVVCVDINKSWNDDTVSEIEREGGTAYGYKCDISDKEDIRNVCQKIRDEVGDISILVNNAGIMPCKAFSKHTDDEIEKLFKINVFAHFILVKEWLPTFKNNGRGHIVALSSLAGVMGTPNLVPYSASKYAVTGFMEGLSEELRYGNRYPGLKLTRIHPSFVDTGLAQKPRIRFPNLTGITSIERCAEIIVEALRKEDEVVYVPKFLYYADKLTKFLPLKCQKAINDFMDTGVDEHD